MGNKNRQLFVDLDGVLADFDSFVQTTFGIKTNKNGPDPPGMWDTLVAYKGRLYFELPLLPGAREFWDELKPHNPVILTGIPRSLPTASYDKQEWVHNYIDPQAKVITCRSRLKSKYGSPGDILIDDREAHKDLWTNMGGVWISHTSPEASLAQLKEIVNG